MGKLAGDLTRDVNDRDFEVALHLVFKDKASHDKYQSAPLRVLDSYVEIAPR